MHNDRYGFLSQRRFGDDIQIVVNKRRAQKDDGIFMDDGWHVLAVIDGGLHRG